jgi:hypothetical protein
LRQCRIALSRTELAHTQQRDVAEKAPGKNRKATLTSKLLNAVRTATRIASPLPI